MANSFFFMDERHLKRIKTMQNLFAYSFSKLPKEEFFKEDSVGKAIVSNLKKIDEVIQSYATRYPIDKISKIDLAILRLATHELLEGKNPSKVIIDEAVTLAKEFGNDKSYAFVNGVLGSILKIYETKSNKS